MTNFIRWNGSVLNTERIQVVHKVNPDGIKVIFVDGDNLVWTWDDPKGRDAQLSALRDALVPPGPMPVLVKGTPGEDDKPEEDTVVLTNEQFRVLIDRLDKDIAALGGIPGASLDRGMNV